jgi:putative copper export protein/methionine-rich copper-binding protein CopC
MSGRALALALFALAAPAYARAHDALQRSVPANDAHLSVAPRSLRLTFTSEPQVRFVRVQLFAPGNTGVALGPLRLDSTRTVVADIAGPLVAGVYTVAWQIAGADGHPVRGRFSFTIAPGAAGLGVSHAAHAGDTSRSQTPQAPPTHHDAVSMPMGGGFDAASPGYVAIRWATFTSMLALLGAVAFRFVVMPLVVQRAPVERANALSGSVRPRAAMLGGLAAAALLVSAFAQLWAQSYALHGGADALNGSLVGGMLRSTIWGWAWLAQAVGAVVALIGFIGAQRGRRAGWSLAAFTGSALAFTLPFGGHAVAVERWAPTAVAADGLHVLGAGGWLGSLFAVLVVGMPSAMSLPESQRAAAVADMVNAFSPTALVFAGVVGITGVFAAWLHLDAISSLWTSTYGRTLLLKLGVLSIVAVTGAYNWRRVRPALGDVSGAARLRRSASIELAVAVIVIAITAVLVATPPPPEASAVTH